MDAGMPPAEAVVFQASFSYLGLTFRPMRPARPSRLPDAAIPRKTPQFRLAMALRG
jgi:hypothetical protein